MISHLNSADGLESIPSPSTDKDLASSALNLGGFAVSMLQELDSAQWRESSFSYRADCVSVAKISDDAIGVRNSKQPDAGTLLLRSTAFGNWIAGIKAGEFDDLAAD